MWFRHSKHLGAFLARTLDEGVRASVYGTLWPAQRLQLRRKQSALHILDDSKRCTKCKTVKPITEFNRYGGKRRHLITSWCKPCSRNPEGDKREKAKQRRERAAGINVSKYIVMDARGWDKKHGFAFDLDRPFVDSLISLPCTYCGETVLRMTLDRIDNAIGHVRSNVVQACVRCNDTRGNMPYEAWLILAPAMRRARELGLFGAWHGRIKRKSTTTEIRTPTPGV